jgi:YjjG family noncanonical pyrimidine nucleotidase
MKNVKHIFFDLDHTLWDFEKNSVEALQEVFEEFQLQKLISNSDGFIEQFQRINRVYWHLYNHGKVNKYEVRVNRFKEALTHFTGDQHDQLAEDLSLAYLARSPYKPHLFPETHETLRYLQKKYALHIITNGFKEVQFIKLNTCGLTDYFNLILCTEEVGKNKPHAIVFETALKKTKAIANESLMIGDNPETDILGAQNCGFQTILFNPNKEIHQVKSTEISALKELQKLL